MSMIQVIACVNFLHFALSDSVPSIPACDPATHHSS
jgi:hypothetical protein